MKNPFNDQMEQIERRIERLNKRGQWVGATASAEWPIDAAYNLVADPGDDSSDLATVRLEAGRWHVFGAAMLHSATTLSAYLAIRVVDVAEWQSGDDPEDDVANDWDNGTAFRSSNMCSPKAFGTVVLEERRFVQLGVTKVSGSSNVKVDFAKIFAIPG